MKTSFLALITFSAFLGCANSDRAIPSIFASGADTSFDPRWTSFGLYIATSLKSIDAHWDKMLNASKVQPKVNTFVVVKFRMEATKGAVSEILSVDGDGDELGKKLCVGAISAAGPFGAWTDQMRLALGTSQDISIKFSYR